MFTVGTKINTPSGPGEIFCVGTVYEHDTPVKVFLATISGKTVRFRGDIPYDITPAAE
jgi:hypothetical protein